MGRQNRGSVGFLGELRVANPILLHDVDALHHTDAGRDVRAISDSPLR